jgi:hypothetical protein
MSTSPQSRLRLAAVALAGAAAVVTATCNYGEVTVIQPAAKPTSALTLTIQPDGEDAAVAQELGWSAGIPGAEVTVSPANVDTAVGLPVATLETDSAGRISVPDLADTTYLVEVRRLLTPAEAARLASTEDAVGFMARAVVRPGDVALAVPASHRNSMVISEYSYNPEAIPNVGGYEFGGYLELANNSDTTVYLDGLVVGQGFAPIQDYPSNPCASWEYLSNDPDGIWANRFDSLPGTGHTYPLAAGAVVVIATDAIDHRTISPDGLDLSHADFEGIGTADVDNPQVPNTVTIGPRSWWGDHGIYYYGVLSDVVFVALPVDTAMLPRQFAPSGAPYARIPRAKILDAAALLANWNGFTYPFCPHMVHSNFDRYPARLIVFELRGGPYSIQRKTAYTRADGRKILQDTRNSNADFFLGLRTPFQLP